jgi:hypothetical protein
LQIKTIADCHTAYSKPVKQEVNGTMMLSPLVFPVQGFESSHCWHRDKNCGETKNVKKSFSIDNVSCIGQGTLTEGEGSELLTSATLDTTNSTYFLWNKLP